MKVLPKSKRQWIRLSTLTCIALIIFVAKYLIPFVYYARYEPKIGDILFQPLFREKFVRVIEGATNSQYSHCGVVAKQDGKWFVIAAWGSVEYKSLYKWIRQGRYGKFAVYRLKHEYHTKIPRFLNELEKYLGSPYDYRLTMDDRALYCSELIYKAFKNVYGEKLGDLVRLGDLNYRPYIDFIRQMDVH